MVFFTCHMLTLAKSNKFSPFFIPGDLELCSSLLFCSCMPKVSKVSELLRVEISLLVAEATRRPHEPVHYESTLHSWSCHEDQCHWKLCTTIVSCYYILMTLIASENYCSRNVWDSCSWWGYLGYKWTVDRLVNEW